MKLTAISLLCDTARSEEITRFVTKTIVKDLLPLNFVEGGGFRDLMKYVEPDYQVPSRKTVTARMESK